MHGRACKLNAQGRQRIGLAQVGSVAAGWRPNDVPNEALLALDTILRQAAFHLPLARRDCRLALHMRPVH